MNAPQPPAPTKSVRPPQPYPGLRPFEPDEWSIFFGRESMIDDVIQRLAVQRVVLIHGSSGSGKSSLVRAGVLPKLARQHLRHGAEWLTCAMRPSDGPLWNLAQEFARLEGHTNNLDRVQHFLRQFNRRGITLAAIVGSTDAFAGKRLCILVDQFEELFRFERETSRDEAELFVELLVGAIADDPANPDGQDRPGSDAGAPDVHIAITMRSEFLGECARFDGFAEAVNRTQYLVPRMTREALIRAIRRPAQLYGGEVTLELAERLIADARGKVDELPLIQHGLMLLWHKAAAAASDQPTKLDVHQFEGVGGLVQLLSDHADRVMASVMASEDDAIAIERLFRALSDINADGQAIRRPQSFQQLVAVCGCSAEELHDIVDAFRQDGVSFLTPYVPTAIDDKTIIDISHEALIRCWSKIADPQDGWLQREFNDGLLWRSLTVEARAFQTNRKHVLSPATTGQRVKWFAQHTEAWSGRYGGNWNLVEGLLEASRKMAKRAQRIQRLLMLMLAFIAIFALYAWMLQKKMLVEDTLPFVATIILIILLCGWIAILVTQVSIDYSRQLIPSGLIRTLLIVTAFVLSLAGAVADQLLTFPGYIGEILFGLFVFFSSVTAIWISLLIWRAVRHLGSKLIRSRRHRKTNIPIDGRRPRRIARTSDTIPA